MGDLAVDRLRSVVLSQFEHIGSVWAQVGLRVIRERGDAERCKHLARGIKSNEYLLVPL